MHAAFKILPMALVLASAACPAKKTTENASPLQALELPTGSHVDPDRLPPRWAQRLPVAKTDAKVGDQVWATPPRLGTEMATSGVFRIDGIYGDYLSLVDGQGQRVIDVPAAVVHPTRSAKLREGAVVLCYAAAAPGVLATVVDLSAGSEIEVQYDRDGKTARTTIDHAEPARNGLQVMAFVTFPKAGRVSRGLLVALTERSGWVRTAAGHIEVHGRSSLESIIAGKTWRVGQKVWAFRWSTGYRKAKVIETRDHGLRYRVQIDGQVATEDYFFSALTTAP